jgi:hypothetical protein
VLGLRVPGQRNHGHAGKTLLERAPELIAVHVGQADVDQRDIEDRLFGERERGRGTEDRLGLVAEQGQGFGAHLGGVDVVVDQQDAARVAIGDGGGCRTRVLEHRRDRGVSGQPNGEHCPVARRTRCADRAFVQRDQCPDNGEAEAEAALGAVQGIFTLHEWLEDLRQQIGGDAGAHVAHGGDDLAVQLAGVDRDCGAGRREADGVVQQVDEDLMEPSAIA